MAHRASNQHRKPVASSRPFVGILAERTVARVSCYEFVDVTASIPLRRSGSCDPIRREFLRALLASNAEAAWALERYVASLPPFGTDEMPGIHLKMASTPRVPPAIDFPAIAACGTAIIHAGQQIMHGHLPDVSLRSMGGKNPFRSVNIHDLTTRCAALLRMGRLALRGPTPLDYLPGCVLPYQDAPLKMSSAGRAFLYRRETLRGVSERLHWPKGNSGVTLGPGYDMRERKFDEIKRDLTAIGVSAEIAHIVANGTRLHDGLADEFVRKNRSLIVLTKQQQMELLARIIPTYENRANDALDSSIRRRLFAHEFDALVSFTYNHGSLKFTKLGDAINSGHLDQVVAAFNQFPPGGDKRRRPLEIALFTTGIYG